MPNGPAAVPQPPPDETRPPLPLTPTWTTQRRRLLHWLREKAPSLAELYETAVTLLEEQPLPGRSRIIAHCVREIANALPALLAGVERTRLEYDKRLDKIALARDRLTRLSIQPARSMGSTSIPDPQDALTQEFFNQIEALIKEHKATRAKRDTIAERLFRANRPENRHLGDALRPVLRQWTELKDWFVGHAHDNGKTDAQYDWSDIKRRFVRFERTVLTLGQGFFATIADLDELIRTSTPADVHLVVTQLGHIEHYRYFFEHLNDPAWIPALRAERIFKALPPVEAAGISRWAASEFLVRVADRADPDAVVNALTDIVNALAQQTAANPFVIRDLVDVLLKLPAQHSVRFITRLKKWVYHDSGIFFWRRLGKLITHLAEGGQLAEAVTLLTALLAVEGVHGDNESEYMFRPVKPRISMYEYRQIVEGHLQRVLERTGRALFEVLCDTLQKAAKLSRRSRSSEAWDDSSVFWQPNLASEDEDDHDDVRSLLAITTLNTAQSLLDDGSIELDTLISTLETRRWLIFLRFAFYFLTIPSAPRDMIAVRLTNEPSFRDRKLRKEYDALLQVGFARLAPGEQQAILAWVEAGPENVAEKIRSYEASTGRRATQEDIEKHRRSWQWKRLWPCRTALPATWRERYATLVEEFGEIEAPPPTMREARDVPEGERTPRPEQDLRTLTPAALREYLLAWTPERTYFPYPTRSGLAKVLTSLVTADPVAYANATDQWLHLDPTYLHGIVRGFTAALRADHPFSWASVLSLCRWILAEPRTIPGRSVDRWEADLDWGGTRWWIVELLRVGFQDETHGIPIDLRDLAWHLLETLTMDPDPEVDEDEEDSEWPSQSMNRAINSVRGRAIECLMFYPGWIKRQTGDAGPPKLPAEARAVLDRHLDLTQDPSLAIRSLYGRWLPWILVFDRDWGTTTIPRIFPETSQRYWLAAWEGFISFNNPYPEIFGPLQPVYAQAIAQLGSPSAEADDTRHLRDERLAGHLMTYYWLGYYPIEDETGLLCQFFARASDKVRAEAIEFIGRSLDRTDDPVDPVVLARLQRLWAQRFDEAKQDPATHQAELRAFGWCFGSGKFETRWAVQNLLDVLRLTQRIDPDFQVLEHLSDHAGAFPLEVLECAKRLIEGQTSHVELSSWGEDLRKIFLQTMNHPAPEVRQASDAVIELLGRFGHLDYADLLSCELG